MAFVEKTFDQFVTDMATQFASDLKIKPSFQSGSATLATFKTTGTQMQVLMLKIKQVLLYARLTTATGRDVDTFVEQFGFTRLGAQKATGLATFGLNFVKAEETLILPGTVVQTEGGTAQFVVIKDTSLSAWSESKQAYVITAGSLSIDARIEAVNAGLSSNVLAEQLNTFVTTGAGPDTVINRSIIDNGADQESDDDTKSHFIDWINSRELGTPRAIRAAVRGIKVGVTVTIIENKDQAGNTIRGFVLVVVDDGTGNPSDDFINKAIVAVDEVRPASIEIRVIKPVKDLTDIGVTIVPTPDIDTPIKQGDLEAAVRQAIIDFVDSTDVGETLDQSDLIVVIKAISGVKSVVPNSLVFDGIDGNKTVAPTHVIKHDNVTVGLAA